MDRNPTPKPRHYATIGIGDVFLEPPKHRLPKSYLLGNDAGKVASFVSVKVRDKTDKIMAVDEGEPTRNFLSDVWSQLRGLRILDKIDLFTDNNFFCVLCIVPSKIVNYTRSSLCNSKNKISIGVVIYTCRGTLNKVSK